jgi:hypothetical protein
MVSNVPHDIVIGTSPGNVLQNKPGMLLLIVPLIAFGYFGYGNWNGGGARTGFGDPAGPRVAPGRSPREFLLNGKSARFFIRTLILLNLVCGNKRGKDED